MPGDRNNNSNWTYGFIMGSGNFIQLIYEHFIYFPYLFTYLLTLFNPLTIIIM